MKKKLILVTLFSQNFYCQELSYNDIVNYTLKHSSMLKKKEIETSIEDKNLELLKSKEYPQISFVYNGENYKNLDDTQESITVGNNVVNSSVKYKSSAGLNLSYDIYDFGSKKEQIKAQKKEVAIKSLEKCDEEIKIKEEILKNYTNALNASYEMETLNNTILLTKKIYEFKQRVFDAGMISSIEVTNELMKLMDYESKFKEANKTYLTSLISLQHISYNLVNSKTLLKPLEFKNSRGNISYENTHFAKQYELKIKQKENEKNSYIKSNLPKVSLSSNYYFYGSNDESFESSFNDMKENSYNIGVNLRVNLFEGFKYSNQIDKYDLEKKRLELEDEIQKENYQKEQATSKENIEQLNELLQINGKSLNDAQELFAKQKRLNEVGKADVIPKYQAMINLLQKELDYKQRSTLLATEQIKSDIKVCKEK